jgi:hypothetical protein
VDSDSIVASFALPICPEMLERLELKLASPPRVKLLLSPESVEVGNNTLPFARRPGPPVRVLNAAPSLASRCRPVSGLAGDGEVARKSIKSAASVSPTCPLSPVEALGVVCVEIGSTLLGGGVEAPLFGIDKDPSLGGAVVVEEIARKPIEL